MKINLVALPLSFILGLMPFALIAVDDVAAAKTDAQVQGNTSVVQAEHASWLEGR
ncbi:MAG: hypothetical protein QOK23_2073 [Gammaproteobacteria bacterium]|jgi:hypothetical protein|nr:hypothetical protein [Gammaproteobacteria bacterium]